MFYNKIDRGRYVKGRRHLIELTRAYGLKDILVQKEGEKSPQYVMARTYVLRVMRQLQINIKEEKTRNENWKPIYDNLTSQQLTILFFRAIFNMKAGYLEDYTPENEIDEKKRNAVRKSMEQDVKWLHTFSGYDDESLTPFPYTEDGVGPGAEERREEIEECKALLSDLRISRFHAINGINDAFIALAAVRVNMTQSMRDALISLTDNQELRDYIDYFCDKYKSDLSETNWLIYFKSYKLLRGSIVDEKLNIKRNEVEKLKLLVESKNKEIKELKEEMKRLKSKYGKEYGERLQRTQKNNKTYRNLGKALFVSLTDYRSKLVQSYNLNQEDDIRQYLSWFENAGKVLRRTYIESIVRHRITDNDAKILFRNLALEMNTRNKEKKMKANMK